MIAMVLAVLFAAGCVSNDQPANETAAGNVHTAEVKEPAEKEASSESVRYVELQGIDGTKIGGEYQSESAAFVTLIPLYVIDEYGNMVRGNGVSTALRIDLITSMINITDPSEYINETLEQQRIEAEKAKAERVAWEAKLRNETPKWER